MNHVLKKQIEMNKCGLLRDPEFVIGWLLAEIPRKPVSALKILRRIMRLLHVCSHFLSATFWKTCVLRFYDMSCLFISTPHVFAYEKSTEFAQKPHVLVSIAEKLL